MSIERTHELTETELDTVSGGFTTNEHGEIGGGEPKQWTLLDMMNHVWQRPAGPGRFAF